MSVTTQVDPISLDQIYNHLLVHEVQIEHNLPTTKMDPISKFFYSLSYHMAEAFMGEVLILYTHLTMVVVLHLLHVVMAHSSQTNCYINSSCMSTMRQNWSFCLLELLPL